MINVKQHVENTAVFPNISRTSVKTFDAVIVDINEYENTCSIEYLEHGKKMPPIDNVPVKIMSEEDRWFPKINDIVKVENIGGGFPVIIGKSIINWEQEIRPLLFDNSDIMAYCSWSPGGYYGC